MMRRRQTRRAQRGDGAAPALLPTFFVATLAMVGAVVGIAAIDSDWADLGAIVILIAVLAFLLSELMRRLDDDEPGPPGDGP
jgi:hypothetical protein